jgi:hypothetical protein
MTTQHILACFLRMDNQIFSRKKAEETRDGFLENGQPNIFKEEG